MKKKTFKDALLKYVNENKETPCTDVLFPEIRQEVEGVRKTTKNKTQKVKR